MRPNRRCSRATSTVWYWQVKGHVGGLTPHSAQHELQAAAPSIPVFALGS